jgi:hypothetical protein
MPLPPDTKYKVANALVAMTRMYMVETLQSQGIEMDHLDIIQSSKLEFTIRIRSMDLTGPRHIAIKVSEPW